MPFVRDNDNYVNSSLKVKIKGLDTSFQMVYSNQYSRFGFDTSRKGWSARNVFHLFATFNYEIFGHKRFLIRNPRIFNSKKDSIQLIASLDRINGRKINSKTMLMAETECVTLTFCYKYAVARISGNQVRAKGSKDIVPVEPTPCSRTETIEYCTTFYYDDPGGGAEYYPGIPETGGGGGGSTGGWYYPPECPPSIARMANVIPCDEPEGWEPLDDGTEAPLLSISPNKDEIVTPCIRAAKDKLGDININIFANNLWSFPGSTTFNWTIDYIEKENLTVSDFAETTTYFSEKRSEIAIKPSNFNGINQANSSQEFAGALLLHEIVHVFLQVYMDKYNIVSFEDVDHHKIMIRNLITEMSGTLQRAYGISELEAKHLAIQGCDDVLRNRAAALYSWNLDWSNFILSEYNIDVSDAEVTFLQYKAGLKGTKCL